MPPAALFQNPLSSPTLVLDHRDSFFSTRDSDFADLDSVVGGPNDCDCDPLVPSSDDFDDSTVCPLVDSEDESDFVPERKDVTPDPYKPDYISKTRIDIPQPYCKNLQTRLGVNATPGDLFFPVRSTSEITVQACKDLDVKMCPLNAEVWKKYLQCAYSHFPLEVAVYIDRCIWEGVPLAPGFDFFHNFTSPERAYEPEEKDIIGKEYDREVSLKRIAGPFASIQELRKKTKLPLFSTLFLGFHFAIKKKRPDLSKPQKWRRIDHLSFPFGLSVNSRIFLDDFPVRYPDYRTGI